MRCSSSRKAILPGTSIRLAFTHWSSARFYDNNYFAIDPKVAYGPMNVNRNHVWVTNFIYDLPFGKGKSSWAIPTGS